MVESFSALALKYHKTYVLKDVMKHFLLHYNKPNPLPSISAESIDSLNWL